MGNDCGCDDVRADHKYQMPDGSYPIDACTGENSVKSAALLAHHSKTYSFAQVKAHVMKAKAGLKCPDSVLPASWSNNPSQSNSMLTPYDVCERGVFPIEIRAAAGDEGRPILAGHFAVFNRWTDIDSVWEGRFRESIAPGAFKRSFDNYRHKIRVLFQHGKDQAVGDKVLGPIAELREDDEGAYYEVPLYNGIPELVMEGLRDGQYGASFRFRVPDGGDKWDHKPARSDDNPDQLPERIVTEAQVFEFGPVTFAAYDDATAKVRSLTDEYHMERLAREPARLRELLERYSPAAALSRGHEPTHSSSETRDRPSRWPQVSREEFILGKSGSGRTPFDP